MSWPSILIDQNRIADGLISHRLPLTLISKFSKTEPRNALTEYNTIYKWDGKLYIGRAKLC